MHSRFWSTTLMALLLVGAAIAVACSSGDDSSEGDGPATTLDVTANEFSFSPGEMRLNVQQRYQIRLKNEGQVLHDWTVDSIPASDVSIGASDDHDMDNMGGMGAGESRLHIAVDRGKSADLSFTPTRAGEYAFYCTVVGHREAGMQGKLVVEP